MNEPLRKLLASDVSHRQSGRILGLHPITVARKLRWIAAQERIRQQALLQSIAEGGLSESKGSLRCDEAVARAEIQFDELETFEHTKCKPLSVPIVVDARSRLILGVAVASMPAKGPLAAISRKKYGKRADHRSRELRGLLEGLRSVIPAHSRFTSDSNPLYPGLIRAIYPRAQHTPVLSRRSSLGGQGELKKIGNDPLFSLNHTCAMFRAHVSRLIRRTWNTTKKPSALLDHLIVYMGSHNRRILGLGL